MFVIETILLLDWAIDEELICYLDNIISEGTVETEKKNTSQKTNIRFVLKKEQQTWDITRFKERPSWVSKRLNTNTDDNLDYIR